MWEEFKKELTDKPPSMRPYEGFIFICGGPSDVTSTFPISVRDALQREIAKDRNLESLTRIAEHYKDWSQDSIYSDLLDFEKHIAELSSVIVLILESAGSIAELGLFTAIKAFREKLLVVMENDYYLEPSFIRLGPIAYLEKTYRNMAECHRWHSTSRHLDQPALSEIQVDLASSIRERIKIPEPSREFSPDSWRDISLLACDLISVFSALTFKEVQRYLIEFGAKLSDNKTHQLLYIMQRLGFIYMEPKGTQRFYIAKDQRTFVSFSFSEEHFDLLRFRQKVLEHYSKSDKKRHRAILEVRQRHE